MLVYSGRRSVQPVYGASMKLPSRQSTRIGICYARTKRWVFLPWRFNVGRPQCTISSVLLACLSMSFSGTHPRCQVLFPSLPTLTKHNIGAEWYAESGEDCPTYPTLINMIQLWEYSKRGGSHVGKYGFKRKSS